MNRKIYLPAALLLGTAGQALAGMAGPMPDMSLHGKYKKPGFEFCTKDRANCLTLGGSLQVDYTYFDENQINNSATVTGSTLGNGADIRRARIYVKGHLANDWAYKIQYDVSQGQMLKDAYLRYTGFDNLYFTAGHFWPSTNMEAESGQTVVPFMEKAQAVQAFSPARRMTAQVNYYNDWMMAAASVFGADYRPRVNGLTPINNMPIGGSARLNVSPWNETGRVATLGASYWAQEGFTTVAGNNRYALANNAGLNAYNGGRTVGFAGTQVKHVGVANVEGALVYGQFDASGAYYWTRVERADLPTGGQAALKFSGFYVQGGWFFTGEVSKWNSKAAKWAGKTANNNDFGAVQGVLRYDSVDMNDSDNNSFNGRQDNFTVGVNYYPTDVVRFGLNYVHGKFKPGNNNADQNINMVGVRAQVLV